MSKQSKFETHRIIKNAGASLISEIREFSKFYFDIDELERKNLQQYNMYLKEGAVDFRYSFDKEYLQIKFFFSHHPYNDNVQITYNSRYVDYAIHNDGPEHTRISAETKLGMNKFKNDLYKYFSAPVKRYVQSLDLPFINNEHCAVYFEFGGGASVFTDSSNKPKMRVHTIEDRTYVRRQAVCITQNGDGMLSDRSLVGGSLSMLGDNPTWIVSRLAHQHNLSPASLTGNMPVYAFHNKVEWTVGSPLSDSDMSTMSDSEYLLKLPHINYYTLYREIKNFAQNNGLSLTDEDDYMDKYLLEQFVQSRAGQTAIII